MSSPDFVKHLRPAVPGNPVLESERSKSMLNVAGLSKTIYGEDYLVRQAHILQLIQSNPLFNKSQQLNLSRIDRFKLILLRAKTLRRMTLEHKWSEDDFKMAEYLVDDIHPYVLHNGMFTVTVREQGSDAQRAKWMPLIENWEITGCYAQTELGHGSNVRGLETVATYDPKTKEFVLHSPTLTASKWWNGGMGKLATHAIVVAQLLVPKGSDFQYCGILPFFVQIRDSQTRKPLPGIVVGDIGPKYGYPGMDNGFMLFNQHRIPFEALLSRYSRINPDTNQFEASPNPSVAYGSMTFIRYLIIMQARTSLARAVTIAIRYTSIRRQFNREQQGLKTKKHNNLPSTNEESAVLDYSTVQIRLFPLLASAFAFHYSAKAIHALYHQNRQNVDERDDFSLLAELHLATTGLKSLCTDIAAGGIETCRRSLGGHGFGGASGFINLNNDYLSRPTVEGDNWMITQQTAKALIKLVKTVIESPSEVPDFLTAQNLVRYKNSKMETVKSNLLTTPDDIVEAFATRAAYLSFKAYERAEKEKKPWDFLLLQMRKLSIAHTQFILVHNFLHGIRADFGTSLQSEEGKIFLKLFELFSLYTISNEQRDFDSAAGLGGDQIDQLEPRIMALMQEIRPHAVRLVDAWAIPDFLLDSALGRADGHVYEDLYHRASSCNPMNDLVMNHDYRVDEAELGSNDGISILAKL